MRNICILTLAFVLAVFISVDTLASIKIDIPGPSGSVTFGDRVFTLPNGNIVVRDSGYVPPGAALGATAAGAVHLLNGRTGQIISTLTGNQIEDDVGRGIHVLPNGDFVVASNTWANAGMLGAGAVTHCSGVTGCSGTISASNSLVGTVAGERVGINLTVLPNGNYVTHTRYWSPVPPAKLGGGVSGLGAMTFCNGNTGCTGVISAANSVVGENIDDFAESRIQVLSDGDFLFKAPRWDEPGVPDAGAVRKCSAATGCIGQISSANSHVGSSPSDVVGINVDLLPGGGYVIINTTYDNPSPLTGGSAVNVGSVTFCNDPVGCTGTVSAANSLLGASPDDIVGNGGVKVLPNGKVLVGSSNWDQAGEVNVGAVTICPSVTLCTGIVTTANSLHGVSTGDGVGSGITVLANGNYVVNSSWFTGVGMLRGASTFCNGTTGCTGPVTEANSLYGAVGSDDRVGSAHALPNGNYFVESREWDNGAAINVGAITFCSGTTGCVGEVNASNSLTGIDSGDILGGFPATILSNGNFVIVAPNAGENDEGAVTFCSGTTGCPVGPVNSSNSLFGETVQDRIGGGGVLILESGNYVVLSPNWDRIVDEDNGLPPGAFNLGAATFCNGTTGCTGFVTEANSLVGNNIEDFVGQNGFALGDKYLVGSPRWGGLPQMATGPMDLDFGALAVCDASVGCTGEITLENSLIGATDSTVLGNQEIEELPNGDYVVVSSANALFNEFGGGGGGPSSLTYGDGINGTTGVQTEENTVFAPGSGIDWKYDPVYEQVVAGRGGENLVTLFRPAAPQPAPFDFDGDGRTDLSVFRPATGTWWLNRSTDGVTALTFGLNGDIPSPADYDGDGKADIAVWRPGAAGNAAIYILNSSDFSVTARLFGQTGDDPLVVGDWDGDGKADPAVYRDSAFGAQSRFYYIGSDNNPGNGITFLNWGNTGDKPLRGDFDGDGKQDMAVYRPLNQIWYINQSSDATVRYESFGLASDIRLDGDFDGDGKTDLALYRPSELNWYWLRSSNLEFVKFPFGLAGDQLAPGDYDGDGKTDVAVFRNGQWIINNSGSGLDQYTSFGATGDIAIPSRAVGN